MTIACLNLRPLAHCSLLALSLAACNARLAITDDAIGGSAGQGSTNAAGEGGTNAAGEGGTSAAGYGGNAGAAGAAGSSDEVDACTNGPVECDSGICLDGVCQPPSCEDGVRNGAEDGVDCGGPCATCLTLCQSDCAVSDVLIPLGCDPDSEGPTGLGSVPRSNEDGSIIAFDYCFSDARCTPMYWTATDGVRSLPVTGGGQLAGMSEDGQVLLANPQSSFGSEGLLLSLDGDSVGSGIAPSPAIVTANGALVGVSPATSDAFALLRRTRGGDVEPLGELPFGRNQFGFAGATPDASTIVGYSFAQTYQPFRYTTQGGLVFGLEGLPETADGATINALSRDGQAFAGVTMLGSQQQRVFRWTEADGVVELGAVVIPTPGIDPSVMALDDDGSVLAFTRETNAATGDFGAFRWTSSDGQQPLLPGVQSVATLVSGDGGVIIGQTLDVENYRAFIWTPARGARGIRAELEASGVELRGWSFSGAPVALSRDGKVAVGVGTCGGRTTAYRLVLPE